MTVVRNLYEPADEREIAADGLIGAALADNEVIARVKIQAADFPSQARGQIWAAISELVKDGGVADAVSVADRLQRTTGRDWLGVVGTIAHNHFSAANAAHYAELVRIDARARDAQGIGETLAREVARDPEAVGRAIRDLLALDRATTDHDCSNLEAVREALELVDKAAANGELAGLPTGITALDGILSGLVDSDLIVVGARPAMGKTSFLLNLALSQKPDTPIGIISGEQPRGQIAMREAAIAGRWSLVAMRRGDPEDWDGLSDTFAALSRRPIWINDKAGPTIDDAIAQARSWKFHHGIKVLLVDYLQKIRGGEGEKKADEIGDVTARFKDLARELEIPVVVLAQVKREVESRPLGKDGMGRIPYMADIAQSGIIEQEADQVVTLYRPAVYDPQRADFNGLAWGNICKNRHGPTGLVPMAWDAKTLRFSDISTDYEEG